MQALPEKNCSQGSLLIQVQTGCNLRILKVLQVIIPEVEVTFQSFSIQNQVFKQVR